MEYLFGILALFLATVAFSMLRETDAERKERVEKQKAKAFADKRVELGVVLGLMTVCLGLGVWFLVG